MYKLPKGFDASIFVGCSLELVCFSSNNVTLHFSKTIVITVESTFMHYDKLSKVAPSVVTIPVAQSDIMQLLGHSVRDAAGDEQGTLVLVFDHNRILEIYDSSSQYESYQIRHGDQLIVV
jgi:hypothetical protein